ncbi:MAG: PDZ domain-containing protein [Saprospiraceae bacterium]|nr:PDZ domain-containing protein [Saprospiraceae bacterium]
MKTNTRYEIWQPFLLAAMVVVGMLVGVKMNDGDLDFIEAVDVEGNLAGPVGRVEEIVRFIESKYVDSLDSDAILESAIRDIMDDLDPHSIYLSEAQLKGISEQMNGFYRGIGVESFYINDTLRISRVIKGSPADKTGIQPFDKIIAIGDSVVAGVNKEYSEIREFLRADQVEQLKVTIKRPGQEDIIESIILPDDINIQSSKVAYEIDDDIAYIKIDRFSSNTYKEFMDALERMIEDHQTRHLIIDLRDNPGGYLPETVNILSQLFNEKGRLLVYTQGKNESKVEYKTTGKNFFPVDQIAVLIDEGSASGSEIIAGAIQDWDRGLIIGRRSFGKGLVQEQYSLRNGGAIRLTISRYYTPTGRSIQKPYDDLKDYDNDIYDRYSNGEVYGSEESTAVNDSMVYYTNLLRRPVYGGGGIIPDVFIPADSTMSLAHSEAIFSYIPEYVYLTRERKQSQELSVSGFRSFLSDEKEGQDINNLTINESFLLKKIQSELKYQLQGEQARDSVMNIGDPFIDEAINYFRSDTDLKKYLN